MNKTNSVIGANGGANRVGRPPKDARARHNAMSVSLPPEVARALRKLAQWHNWNVSRTIATLLRMAPDKRWQALLSMEGSALDASATAPVKGGTAEPEGINPADYDDGEDETF